MAKEEIFDKLKQKLETEHLSEEGVIYILSRVRKLLEIDYLKRKHQNGDSAIPRFHVLWFYCSFALHVIMDRNLPDSVYKSLIKIKDGTDYSGIWYPDFHKEFRIFLKENNLSESIYTQNRIIKFNSLLNSIYSNTPIILEDIKYKVSIDQNGGILFEPYKDLKDIIEKF
jgi:hypothetical protein